MVDPSSFRLGDVSHVVNLTPYGYLLDAGGSRQAPDGIIEPLTERVQFYHRQRARQLFGGAR